MAPGPVASRAINISSLRDEDEIAQESAAMPFDVRKAFGLPANAHLE
jgi:hypothetical protein